MKKEITYEELQAAASYVQARLPYTPKVALVLGSGLGGFAAVSYTHLRAHET